MIGGAALGQVSPTGDGDPKSCPGVVTRSRGVTGRGVIGRSFGRELGGVGTSSPGVDTERRGLSFGWSTTVMEAASAQCAPCATCPAPPSLRRTNDQQRPTVLNHLTCIHPPHTKPTRFVSGQRKRTTQTARALFWALPSDATMRCFRARLQNNILNDTPPGDPGLFVSRCIFLQRSRCPG